MRYLLTALLLFISAPLAAQTEAPRHQETNALQIAEDFKMALAFYQEGRYSEAYDAFHDLYAQVSDNDTINFYLGRSAYHLKRYEESASAFERVLITNPGHTRSRLEFARSLYMLGLLDESEKELTKALESSPPPAVEKNIYAFLKLIDRNKKRSFFSAFVAVGLMNDDNARTASNESTYTLPAYNVTVSAGADKESDLAHHETAGLNYIYDMGDKGAWYFQMNGVVYAQSFSSVSDNDILFLSLKPSIGHKNGEGTAMLTYGQETMQLGGSDYLATSFFEPAYIWTPFKWFQGGAYLKMVDKKFQESADSDRDSSLFDFGMNGSLFFGDQRIQAGLSLGSEKKVSGNRTDVDNTFMTTNISYSLDLPGNYSVMLQGVYKTLSYKDTDPLFVSKRSDSSSAHTVQVSKKLSKQLVANGSYAMIDNSSNQAPYSYTKGVLNVSASYFF